MTIFWLVCGALAFLGLGVLFGAPYVPSKRREVARFFDKALLLSPKDVVLDFGSGDGLVLREVTRRGARAVGIEVHPLLVAVSWLLNRLARSSATVRWGDAWRRPFSDDTTIVYAFAVQKDGRKLLQKVQHEATRLGRPLRLVSYGNLLPGRRPEFRFEACAVYQIKPRALQGREA